jgi:biotin carboxylase
MKHLLLVGGHDETYARFVGLPYRFSAIQLESSIGDAQRALLGCIEVVPVLEASVVAERARSIHTADPVDLVFSFTEDGLLPAAAVARELGIEGIDYEACLACIDKPVMRARFEHTAYRIDSAHCTALDQALAFFAMHPRGVVLKDPRGAGSRHVAVAYTAAEVEAHWSTLIAHIDHVLVEEYIGGHEYSVETLTIRGRHEVLGITEKHLRDGTLVEELHVFPATGLGADLAARIDALAIGVLEVLGYRHGPCHIEVKVDDGEVRLIEINNRAGGDFIWELVWLTRGVDMFRETLAYAFEGEPDASARAGIARHATAASRFFFVPQCEADVRSALEGVSIERCLLDDDDNVLRPVNDSDDRYGVIVIGAADEQPLRAALSRAGAAAPVATAA